MMQHANQCSDCDTTGYLELFLDHLCCNPPSHKLRSRDLDRVVDHIATDVTLKTHLNKPFDHVLRHLQAKSEEYPQEAPAVASEIAVALYKRLLLHVGSSLARYVEPTENATGTAIAESVGGWDFELSIKPRQQAAETPQANGGAEGDIDGENEQMLMDRKPAIAIKHERVAHGSQQHPISFADEEPELDQITSSQEDETYASLNSSPVNTGDSPTVVINRKSVISNITADSDEQMDGADEPAPSSPLRQAQTIRGRGLPVRSAAILRSTELPERINRSSGLKTNGTPWSKEEDELLKRGVAAKLSYHDIADQLGHNRTTEAARARWYLLNKKSTHERAVSRIQASASRQSDVGSSVSSILGQFEDAATAKALLGTESEIQLVKHVDKLKRLRRLLEDHPDTRTDFYALLERIGERDHAEQCALYLDRMKDS